MVSKVFLVGMMVTLSLFILFAFATAGWTLYKLHQEDDTDWDYNLYTDPTHIEKKDEQRSID